MFGFPIPIVSWVIYYGISFIILAMFVRAVASWFRIDERYAIIRFLARITDPFILTRCAELCLRWVCLICLFSSRGLC